MARRAPKFVGLVGAAALAGCSTWTSVRGGYANAPDSGRGEAGLGVNAALGGATVHSPFATLGAHASGADDLFQTDLNAGIMRPLDLGRRLTFVPSAGIELGSIANVEDDWYGGALGPRGGAELVWWLWMTSEVRPLVGFGCMGGVMGVDCPRCRARRVSLSGVSFGVMADGPSLIAGDHERLADWKLWFLLGATHAVSAREDECCAYDHGATHPRDCKRQP